jgi:hypothetical protein
MISRNIWLFIGYYTMHDQIPNPPRCKLGFVTWIYSLETASPLPHIQEEAALFQGVTTAWSTGDILLV